MRQGGSSVAARAVQVAGEAGLPAALSPTAAKTFRQCELRWWWGSVAGWRTPPTRHTLLGNVVHDALERLYALPGKDRTRPAADRLLDEAWDRAGQDERNMVLLADRELAAQLRLDAAVALDGLWHLEEPRRVDVDPDGLETWVSAPLHEAPVRGRIDRMTDDGVWRVTDYKTGKVPAPRYVEGGMFGLWTYAAALAASHPDRRIPDEVELLFLRAGVRIVRPVLRPYLRGHARSLGHLWRAAGSVVSSGRVRAERGPLCNWCDFRPACPLFGADRPAPGSPDSDALLAAAGLRRRQTTSTDLAVEELLDERGEDESGAGPGG